MPDMKGLICVTMARYFTQLRTLMITKGSLI